MHIPRYWAKVVRSVQDDQEQWFRLVLWQWSDLSLDEARQKAEARMAVVAQKVQTGQTLDRYGYGERPLREEIVGVVNPTGKDLGVITRNSYGALVLNATDAMFVDIDFPENDGSAPLGGALGRLFGGRPPSSPEERYAGQVAQWAATRPDLGLRLYRTAGGLRCLVVNQVFDPQSADSQNMLRSLNSDPLYIRLCQAQSCFRARLTPKPWRCRLGTPPAQYPFEDAAAEARYRQWQARYEQTGAGYATCRLIRQFGPQQVHPDVEPVLTLHDQMTGVTGNRPLA